MGGAKSVTINRELVFQLFKYVVYILLSVNIFIFFQLEWAASVHRFANGINLDTIIKGFAATIDTASWVVLLLLFELETYVLNDSHYTRKVTWTLHGVRVLCYSFIIYAFYGYVSNVLFVLGVTPLPNLTDVCSLVTDAWSYARDTNEFIALTAGNCSDFAGSSAWYKMPGAHAVVGSMDYTTMETLAWVDAINAAVWLLIVVVLEMDVYLQEHNRLVGPIYLFSKISKFILYSALFLAAIYWGFEGSFVDFWDAFLWLVAFIFIEMNVVEWRQETLEETAAANA